MKVEEIFTSRTTYNGNTLRNMPPSSRYMLEEVNGKAYGLCADKTQCSEREFEAFNFQGDIGA